MPKSQIYQQKISKKLIENLVKKICNLIAKIGKYIKQAKNFKL